MSGEKADQYGRAIADALIPSRAASCRPLAMFQMASPPRFVRFAAARSLSSGESVKPIGWWSGQVRRASLPVTMSRINIASFDLSFHVIVFPLLDTRAIGSPRSCDLLACNNSPSLIRQVRTEPLTSTDSELVTVAAKRQACHRGLMAL